MLSDEMHSHVIGSVRRETPSEFALLTCIRDTSEAGGGIPRVACPVHYGIHRMFPAARLFSGGGLQSNVEDCHSMVNGPQGLADFSANSQSDAVVHIHGLWTPFELRAWRYAKRIHAPLVISPHGMLEPWALKHKAMKKLVAWYLYQRRMLMAADMLIVNSSIEYESVRKLGLKAPIAIIENGVDTAGFNSIETIERSRTVLFLSRLSPVKGLPDLLRAWSLLDAKQGHELHLYGNAEPGYEAKILELISDLGIEGTVKVCGPVFGEAKWRVLQSASVFVLPSYSENFGIVIAEALFAGTPVITTNKTPWQAIERGGMGWIVSNDAEQLADAMRRAFEVPEAERNAMGARGNAYVRENLLWDKVIEKYVRAYRWVRDKTTNRPDFIYL